MNVYKKSGGFTLLELLIAIIIFAVLSAMISGSFFLSLKKGRDSRRKTDLEQIQKAIEMFYEDQKAYPSFDIFATSNLKLCQTKIASDCGTEKTYMQKIPNDPFTNKTYAYVSSSNQTYGLYACLENTEQVLPTTSTNYGSFSCSVNCKDSAGASTPCIWGISDSNSLP